MTAVAITNGAHGLWGSSGAATSTLRGLFRDARRGLSQADLWNRLESSILELGEVYDECAVGNWDGYGAQPVSASAYEEAMTILYAIPHTLPIPEVAAEPDGSIALEWYIGPDRLLSLSVSGKGKIVYAGLLGKGNKAHGTEVYNDSIPSTIIGLLERLCR